MALIVKDRVREVTSTTGTGTITLTAAVVGFQSFSVIGDGNQTYYTIVDAATGAFEVGIGTYTASGTTLSRDTVLESSNANALVSFSSGTKDVFVTYPADRSVSQADIGTEPNEIPLNQYLGALAYVDTEYPQVDIGTGITSGTGTICKANAGSVGGVYKMTVLIDLTGLNSGGTAGDIIGVNGTALPCYIARLPTMTVLGGRMTCLEAPAGGDDDIDLYSAAEGTGVEDSAITALTETQIINGGTQSAGTVTYFAADPSANHYFYLVGQSTSDATYTAGRFLIEVFGV